MFKLYLEYIKVVQCDLPMLIGKTTKPKIEVLTIEIRLNYSNESSNTNSYYRRNTIELRLEYLSSVTFEIIDIQTDEE
jgi:hypothetical protein